MFPPPQGQMTRNSTHVDCSSHGEFGSVDGTAANILEHEEVVVQIVDEQRFLVATGVRH